MTSGVTSPRFMALARLMMSTSLVSIMTFSGSALAAQAQPGKKHPVGAPHKSAKPVEAKGEEEISVTTSRQALNGGGGMMRIERAPRTVQTVDHEYISMRNPSSTALDLIQNLPSVSISTPDPYGMQGGQIQARGLTDLDMALLVDGAPAAAAKYITENVDTENLESVSLTPGSSETALPVMSAAGGTMNEQTHTPAKKFGGLVDFSYGTNNLSREFIRLDTGEIGHTGVHGYFSFSNTHTRSWMGAGINDRRHIDFGLNKLWENGSYAKTFVSWNWEDFTIDNYPTAQQFYRYKHTGQGYGRSADSSNINYWKNNTDYWNQVLYRRRSTSSCRIALCSTCRLITISVVVGMRLPAERRLRPMAACAM